MKQSENKEFKGYWYLYIHSKLKERSINNYISLNEAKNFLFEWRVPKQLRIIIIKELEQLGLIEFEDKYTIRFNRCNIDLDNLTNLYEDVGLVNLN